MFPKNLFYMKLFEHTHYTINEKRKVSPKLNILHIANLLIKQCRFDLKKCSLGNAVTYCVNGKMFINKLRKQDLGKSVICLPMWLWIKTILWNVNRNSISWILFTMLSIILYQIQWILWILYFSNHKALIINS